jgi:DNA repair exonuclease SbcCD nuclease subunit
MKTDRQLVERITGQPESYLESARDSLVESILEGVKEGAIEGLKKGAREALKECLTTGFSNVEAADITDILADIPPEIVKSGVKEGAKVIFKRTTEGYIKKACQKLIQKMKKEGVKLTKGEIDLILEILKTGERETLKQIVAKLPHNPLFGAIIDGMEAALEESLEKNFAACAQEMQKATAAKG